MKSDLQPRPFHYFLLCLLVLIGYAPSLANGFMLDDHLILFGEKGVMNKTFTQIFAAHQGAFYRPVGHIFLWLSYRLFGQDPFLYHLENIVLFVVACVLFYTIVNQLFRDRRLALLSSALFAVHPVNSMLVNYVTVTVITTFLLTIQAAFLVLIKYQNSGRRSYYFLSIVFFILSLLSHEMGMMFPAYVLCLAYFVWGRRFKDAFLFSLPFGCLSVLYLFLRMKFVTIEDPLAFMQVPVHTLGAYLSTVVSLICWYVSKLIFPRDIIFLWTVPVRESYSLLVLSGFLIIVALIVYLIFGKWRKGPAPFGLSVFVLGLAPVLVASYVHSPFVGAIIEPHWFYFSSIGFFILAASGILWLVSKSRPVVAFGLIFTVFLGSLTLLTQNILQWKDQETYCRYWLSLNRGNLTPYHGLGRSLMEKGKYHEAVTCFKAGVEALNYYSSYILTDTGYALFKTGRKEKAAVMFKEAIEMDPNYSVPYHYWGLLQWSEGDLEAAERFYQKAVSIYDDPEYRMNLALIRKALDR